MDHDLAITVLKDKARLLLGQLREYNRCSETSAYPEHAVQARERALDCKNRIEALTASIETLRISK